MPADDPGVTSRTAEQAWRGEMTVRYRAGGPARDQVEQDDFQFLADLGVQAARLRGGGGLK